MRAKDEDGRLLPAPHKRLENAPQLEQAGVFAIARDGRFSGMTHAKRLALVRKAIDHVHDGDKPPSWIYKKDPDYPDNHAAVELWRAAVAAVNDARLRH